MIHTQHTLHVQPPNTYSIHRCNEWVNLFFKKYILPKEVGCQIYQDYNYNKRLGIGKKTTVLNFNFVSRAL